MRILRKYPLGTEDGGIGYDTSYSLIFTSDGRMLIRIYRDYSQDFKTPDINEVELRDLADAKVNGRSVFQLALEKLAEILPDPN